MPSWRHLAAFPSCPILGVPVVHLSFEPAWERLEAGWLCMICPYTPQELLQLSKELVSESLEAWLVSEPFDSVAQHPHFTEEKPKAQNG